MSESSDKRSRIIFALFCFLVVLPALFVSSCRGRKAEMEEGHKVVILGFDGLDPKLLRSFVGRGEMPNFKKLMELNETLELGTSTPPQSPVAWANFITGANPGAHGIYDFIHRDPESYLPFLSTSRAYPPKKTKEIGGWVIPLSQGGVENLRGGEAFWNHLVDSGIPATVFRVPSNFPPSESSARTFSGMGTPDLLGGYGSFTFFTDDNSISTEELTGGRVVFVAVRDGMVETELGGPPNTFRKEQPETTTPLTIWVDTDHDAAKIEIQETDLLLNVGEWSEWVQVRFAMVPLFQATTGIVRLYLQQVKPHLKLYVSPINIDPSNPALPISTPRDYSLELFRRFGYFTTLGMPEDTKALDHGYLSDAEYFEQTKLYYDEMDRIFDFELSNLRKGLLFFYFSESDLGQHMFWSAMDANHPGHSGRDSGSRDEIYRIYKKLDGVVGKTLSAIDDDTTLIIISDHGFSPFSRAFNLNTWLKNNGYLYLIDPSIQGETEFLDNVDWLRTKAYSLGFNALYINTIGREAEGTVYPGAEKDELVRKIRRELLEVVDSVMGKHPVSNVYPAAEVYSGKHVDAAPDLIVGYNRGYRASWETALGKVPREMIQDHTDKWSGDHCIDPRLVPGVVLSNRMIKAAEPDLRDIPATVLSEFDVPIPSGMEGKSIFEGD
ncbi:MAG: alkaline phosphatase family protein [bacterium]